MSQLLQDYLSPELDLVSVFPRNYRRMVAEKAKPPEQILDNLRPHPIEAHQLHMAYALPGEVMELEFALMSLAIAASPENLTKVLKELGDCTFYLCGTVGGQVLPGELVGEDVWETALGMWPADLPAPTPSLEGRVLWLKFLTAQFSDVYKRLLFYRTGDTQVSEVTAEAAAKRKRLLAVLQSAAVHMAATIGEIAGLVSPGTDFNDVLDLNIQKLDARYAGGYSDEAAHKRADLAAGEDDCSHAEPPAKDLAYPSAASPA